MAKKEEKEVKLTEKEKKQIKENIMDDIKEDLTTEITEEIVEEINKSFDQDYKDDLKEKISEEISEQIKEEIRKEEKRISRKKSFKIFRLNLYIILLIAAVGAIVYKIYEQDHLEILGLDKIGHGVKETTTVSDPNQPVPIEETDLLGLYSPYMDKIIVNSLAMLTPVENISEMSMSDRIVFAYNTLTKDDIEVEGTIRTIEGTKIKNAYDTIFNTDDYVGTEFSVGGINYKYSIKTDTYIAISDKEEETTNILMEIVDIKEEEEYVSITNIVAIQKDGYIYNIDNNKSSITKYSKGMKLKSYEDKLTKTTFVFEKASKTLYAIR